MKLIQRLKYYIDYIIGKDMVHSLCDREMKPCHLALNFEAEVYGPSLLC